MDILFLVSRVESAPTLRALLRACVRRKVSCGCFLTGPAAALAYDPETEAALRTCARAVVCEYSWERFGRGLSLVSLGSQTDNSAMVAQARRIVSL